MIDILGTILLGMALVCGILLSIAVMFFAVYAIYIAYQELADIWDELKQRWW